MDKPESVTKYNSLADCVTHTSKDNVASTKK